MASLPKQVLGPTVPVLGMVPAIDRSLMVDGQFGLLQNGRCDSGLFVARNQETVLLSKPSWATGLPLGATCCNLNGNPYVVAVWSDGTKSRVVVSPSALDRWVEVTSSNAWTGPSGNNRLTDITRTCQFAIVKTPRYLSASGTFSSRDALLIQNGSDYPRIYDPDTNDAAATKNVTAVANSGGKFQLTIGAHNFSVGDHPYLSSLGGLSLLGPYEITAVGATTITINQTFVAGYSGGGTVQDRADLLVHKPIAIPASVGSSFGTVSQFWQVAGTSGKTYTAAGVVNQARFKFGSSSTAPYANSNEAILWTITNTATAADIAKVQFAASMTLGKQVAMLWEGDNVSAMLAQAKIEFSPDDVTYSTAYDPSAASQLNLGIQYITQDSTNKRVWVILDTTAIAGLVPFYMRFVRQGSAPAGTQTATCLFIGSPSGNIPGSTEWGFSYEDEYDKVESRFFVMNAGSDQITSLGGVAVVTNSTNTQAAPNLPLVASVLLDYRFVVTNSTGGSTINGGLDGQPERVNFYASLPDATGIPTGTFYFAFISTLYGAGYSGTTRQWVKSFSTVTINVTLNSYAVSSINFNREAPSAFQLPIPIARACLYAHNRAFVGGVKDDTSQFGLGDIYYSWERNPFRWQQVQEDELRGGYVQLGDEEVQAFLASASAQLGAGRVFCYSSKNLYSLGDSGPFATAGFSASDLSRPVIIGPHGTLSPMSVAQGYNAIFWLDQDAQIMRFGPDGLRNICRQTVSSRTEAAVSSRKGRFSGAFRKDRYYFAYTPSAETENNRVLVWNEKMQAWESEDYETVNANFENLMIYSTSSSSSTTARLFFFDTAGALYGYGEDSAGAISIRFATRGYQRSDWSGWYIYECACYATNNSATTLSISRVSRKWGTDEPWTTTLSISETGSDFTGYKETVAHTKVGVDRGEEIDLEWYLDVSGSVAPGTTILRFEFDTEGGADSIYLRT